jgi:hypothetical protein
MAQNLLNLKKGRATDANITREIQVLAVDGAITIKSSTVFITKAGVCAMTLGIPTTAENGTRIVFIATTASAHTLTVATIGINAADGSGDLATWTAAIGNNIVLVAYAGEWYTEGTPRGVAMT